RRGLLWTLRQRQSGTSPDRRSPRPGQVRAADHRRLRRSIRHHRLRRAAQSRLLPRGLDHAFLLFPAGPRPRCFYRPQVGHAPRSRFIGSTLISQRSSGPRPCSSRAGDRGLTPCSPPFYSFSSTRPSGLPSARAFVWPPLFSSLSSTFVPTLPI